MLAEAENALLTGVGPGTPMGEYLRRYWMPIAGLSEFDTLSIKPVRLLGEDLVLYRDLGGRFGLIGRHCPHRRADLSYGFVEECGLRCNYHGWLFDRDGRTLEQPFDDVAIPQAHFKAKVVARAYPVEVKAGLVWAYLGPLPAPLVPTWEPFTWKNGFVQIVISEVPCNWFQAQENSIDPVHFEWMHMNWGVRLQGKNGPYAPRHLKVAFDEFDHGFTYRRVTEATTEEDPLWTTGRVCLWPNVLFTGDHFEWRVPVDDENMLSVMWAFSRVPNENEPYVQERIPTWHGPVRDAGGWITSHVMNQDFVAWLGQGSIADRRGEHLGPSDRGIIMLRKRFVDDLAAVARGADPKATIRDPRQNECVTLPIAFRKLHVEGYSLADNLAGKLGRNYREYVFQAGQPDAVRQAFERAMGIAPADATA